MMLCEVRLPKMYAILNFSNKRRRAASGSTWVLSMELQSTHYNCRVLIVLGVPHVVSRTQQYYYVPVFDKLQIIFMGCNIITQITFFLYFKIFYLEFMPKKLH